MIDDYSSPNTSTTKNDMQDYNCVLFWISEQDGLKSNMLVQVSFPPCCQLTLCTGVPHQAHAGIFQIKAFQNLSTENWLLPGWLLSHAKLRCIQNECNPWLGMLPPFSPKTIRIALWRTLPKLCCLFLHFFSLLFGGIGLELVVHPSWSAFMCINTYILINHFISLM